jgi:CheY-like chemotaxis protein
MDGWGFLENIRDTPSTSGIPTIAVTAYHSLDVARKAIAAGFDAYFPKPIDSRSFVTELMRIVE